MIGYLLDTDVVSLLALPSPHENVATWFMTVDDHQLAISVLTLQELWKGVSRAQKAAKDPEGKLTAAVQGIMDAFQGRILPLEAEAAKQWGIQIGNQEKHVNDKGIAAIAAAHGVLLVTRNVKHMTGLGVDVLDPFISPAKLHKSS